MILYLTGPQGIGIRAYPETLQAGMFLSDGELYLECKQL